MSRFGQDVKRSVRRFFVALTDADTIGDPFQYTGINVFDKIDAVNMLMIPGVTTALVFVATVAYCENRNDLMPIADTQILLKPLELLPSGAVSSAGAAPS